MCDKTDCALTMAGLLDDPMTQMLMRSDGVSRQAHAALWERIRDAVAARFVGPGPWIEAETAV